MAKDQGDRHFIGVDLGGTNIQTGVLDGKDKIVGRSKTKTKAEQGSDEVIKRIVKSVNDAIDDAKLKLDDVAGLGIGAPGAADYKKGVVINAVNLRWNNFPLAKELEKALKLPVTIDNDVNVGVWGEHVAGAGKGFDEMIGVFVGTGIGGGLVLRGTLYHGHFLTAGEIGHTVVHGDAPLGRRTLENCASRTNVVNLLTQLILANHESKVLDITDGNLGDIRSKTLSKAVADKDKLTIEVIRSTARYVGVSIANMVTMLSLPCAVVGGGLTEALGDTYVDWVREAFDDAVFPPELKACKVLASKLGDDAGVIGAALIARERLGGKR